MEELLIKYVYLKENKSKDRGAEIVMSSITHIMYCIFKCMFNTY